MASPEFKRTAFYAVTIQFLDPLEVFFMTDIELLCAWENKKWFDFNAFVLQPYLTGEKGINLTLKDIWEEEGFYKRAEYKFKLFITRLTFTRNFFFIKWDNKKHNFVYEQHESTFGELLVTLFENGLMLMLKPRNMIENNIRMSRWLAFTYLQSVFSFVGKLSDKLYAADELDSPLYIILRGILPPLVPIFLIVPLAPIMGVPNSVAVNE